MAYSKNENDKGYRIVKMESAAVQKFQDFNAEELTWDEKRGVAEILHDDGSTCIISEGDKAEVSYKIRGNELEISKVIPTARVSIRYKDNELVRYCLPKGHPEDGKLVYYLSDSAEAELVGDKYFSAKYTLIKK